MSTGPEDDEETDGERGVTEDAEQTDDIEQAASTVSGESTAVDDEDWRFSVDDFEDDEDGAQQTAENGSNVAGTLESRQPLEPGDINPENAFFVALGVLIVVGLIVGAMLGL